MTFEEWWANIVKTHEVPLTVLPYSQAEMLAKMAWRVGTEESYIKIMRRSEWMSTGKGKNS